MSDELLLSIEKLVYGGDGLTHSDGNTVFVPYVLPGEGVRAATKTKKKKLIWTKLVEVTSPSAERIAPGCPHFQVCGGCHYQLIPAAAQVRLKIEIFGGTLSRLGGAERNATGSRVFFAGKFGDIADRHLSNTIAAIAGDVHAVARDGPRREIAGRDSGDRGFYRFVG